MTISLSGLHAATISNGTSYSRKSFTPTAGQTVFNVTYNVGYIFILINGSLMSSSDYTATDGLTVTMLVPTSVVDIVEFISWSNGAFIRTTPVPTLAQTTFNVSYTPGYLIVLINGNILTGSEYTALNGSTVVLSTGITNVLDIVEFIAFTSINVVTATTLLPNATISNPTMDNLNFTNASGSRITGDMSNATHANRLTIQSNVVNGTTSLGLIPNGTSTTSQLVLNSAVNPDISSRIRIGTDGSTTFINADITGAGTYLPMIFLTGGTERMRIDTNGNLLVTYPSGLGYGTGAGGAVTQATSKSTAVTINKPTGQITMNNAALAAGASVYFNINNSVLSTSDTVILSGLWTAIDSSSYRFEVARIGSGTPNYITIRVTNITAGSLSEAVIFNFSIIKGASA